MVKGSECLNTLGAKKAATAYRSARNKGDQSIKRRADRQQTVFGTVTKAYADTANPPRGDAVYPLHVDAAYSPHGDAVPTPHGDAAYSYTVKEWTTVRGIL